MEIQMTVLPGQSSPVDRLVFPMLPEEIKVITGGLFAEYTILKKGTVKVPSGRDLTGFTWDGILPGEIRKNAPYVNGWTDPKQLQVLWSIYERDGIKLRLMVTETPINHDVYIESYDMTYKHGMGDYAYTLNLLHAIDLKINLSGENGSGSASASPRPAPPGMQSYTVNPGEDLWTIAQKMYGDGKRYMEVYNLNKDVIDEWNVDKETGKPGKDLEMIHPGQVLIIPNPAPTAPPAPAAKTKAKQTTQQKPAATTTKPVLTQKDKEPVPRKIRGLHEEFR